MYECVPKMPPIPQTQPPAPRSRDSAEPYAAT